jgi:DNA-binding HxlR family transcriptional regulator
MLSKTPSIRCPLGVISVGGKIKLNIGWHLLNGPKRFGELLRLMPETSRQMLTLQLRDLEQLGIIERKVFPQIPARVEYSLSEYGKGLEPILRQMHQWEEEFPWILQ